MGTIIMYYLDLPLIIDKVVADRLKLKNKYIIKTQEEFLYIINENASHGILICDAMIAAKTES